MKVPKKAGSALGDARYNKWLSRFTGYRVSVTKRKVQAWLLQFKEPHRDLAARVLDSVEYFGPEDIDQNLLTTLNRLPGWSKDSSKRNGRWRFTGFSFAAGESGDVMLHKLRTSAGMTTKKYNDLFIHKSELLRENLTSDDTVVFVDDFSGTGDQACFTWENAMEELLPGEPAVYLLLVCATEMACTRIASETEMIVKPGRRLKNTDDIFHDDCKHFSSEEKAALLGYCKKADRRLPKGRGECGLILVFSHRSPNNSIPVLTRSNSKWTALFPRD